jgi:hypothetical protein
MGQPCKFQVDALVHAFAFDGAESEAAAVVTTLVNWDTQADRNTTVSLRCQGRVALYALTPAAMADDEGERGRPVEWAGVAVNGATARVTKDGEIPQGLLEPVYVTCDEAGTARVSLGALTAAFAVVDRDGAGV